MIWSSIKTKAIAIGGAIIASLLVILKILAKSRKKAVEEAKRAKAALSRQKDIQDIDNELEGQLSSRRASIKKEIKEGKGVKNLAEPNDF